MNSRSTISFFSASSLILDQNIATQNRLPYAFIALDQVLHKDYKIARLIFYLFFLFQILSFMNLIYPFKYDDISKLLQLTPIKYLSQIKLNNSTRNNKYAQQKYNRQMTNMNDFEPERYGEITTPLKYQNTNTELHSEDRYIAGLTREEVSQFITNFPFIYHIYKKNKPNDQWKLLDQLMKVPSQSDGPGFIYGFMNEQQNNILEAPYWIKMGRTKQNPPQKRIFQWQRDDDIEITQIFTVRSLYNKKLEALVHTLFAYARKNRELNGKQRIEWFRFEQITLTAAAVNILNHIMNTLHTSKVNKQKIYMNRNLKQITDKITECNNQMKQINKTQPALVVNSFVRDFGIELGKNDQIKLQLQKCITLEEAISISHNFAIGKQINELFNQIKIAQQSLIKYKSIFSQFQQKCLQNIKCIYEKTKINIVVYEPAARNISKDQLKMNKQEERVGKGGKGGKTREKKSNSKRSTEKIRKYVQKKKDNISKNAEVIHENGDGHVQNIQDYVQQLKRQEQKSKQINNSLQTADQSFEKRLIQQMGNMSLQQKNGIAHNDNRLIQQNKEALKAKVYTSQGKVRPEQAQIEMKKIKQNNKILLKYKSRTREAKLDGRSRNKSKHSQQKSIQKKYKPIDLNETKNEQQISHEISNITKWKAVQQSSAKMSQFINHEHGGQFYIQTEQFYLDTPELKLNCNYIIMTKRLFVQNHIAIMKGNNFKGFLRIFYGRDDNIQNLVKIQRNCHKYAAIFKVENNGNIIPMHKEKTKIDETSQQLAKNFLQLFHY